MNHPTQTCSSFFTLLVFSLDISTCFADLTSMFWQNTRIQGSHIVIAPLTITSSETTQLYFYVLRANKYLLKHMLLALLFQLKPINRPSIVGCDEQEPKSYQTDILRSNGNNGHRTFLQQEFFKKTPEVPWY